MHPVSELEAKRLVLDASDIVKFQLPIYSIISMISRISKGNLFGKVAYKFSQSRVKLSEEDLPSNKAQTLMSRVSHKTRRREVNEFLNIKLQANYKNPVNKVSLGDQLKKINGGFKLNQFFLSMGNKKVAYESLPRDIEQWYINSRKSWILKSFKTVANKFLEEVLTETTDGVTRAQPSFELQLRKSVRSLSTSNGKIVLEKSDKEQQLQILYCQLLRGLRIIRNENFEEESYEINTSRASQGVFLYTPVKQQTDRYPEMAYLNMNSVILKVTCLMDLPFNIRIQHNGQTNTVHSSSKHIFVFENQLRLPPSFSEWTLDKDMKSYRFQNPWVVTDIDNSGKFPDYLYSFGRKSRQLVNKIDP